MTEASQRVRVRVRVRQQGVTWRTVDDEVVLLDLHTLRYMAVNESGAALWDAMVGGSTAEELVRILSGRYGRSAGEAEREVGKFLEACGRLRLLAE